MEPFDSAWIEPRHGRRRWPGNCRTRACRWCNETREREPPMNRIVVTGAAGQVGSEMVEALRGRYGHDAV
ncbi:MAG: hypothetical protein WBO43_16245, partial [Gemmatimonadota bacterium]